MRKMQQFLVLVASLLVMVSTSWAQATLTSTTLSTAVTSASERTFVVASATDFVAGNIAYIDREAVRITAVSGTTISVVRGASGTRGTTHASGAKVYVGPGRHFTTYGRSGSCTSTDEVVLPVIDVLTGKVYSCTSSLWLEGFATASITPVATAAAIGTTAQTFTVTGLAASERLAVVLQPAPTSLCPLVAARATAANTVSLYWSTLTAAACTPAAGVYGFIVVR